MVPAGEHVSPESLVRITHRSAGQIAWTVERESDVEPVGRRQRELLGRERIRVVQNVRIALPRVVGIRRRAARDAVID